MYLQRLYAPDEHPESAEKRVRLAKVDDAVRALESVGSKVPDDLVAERGQLRATIEPRKVRAVRILRAGKVQKFSASMLDGGKSEGWISDANGLLMLTTDEGAMCYQIVRTPGVYCCHCDESLGDSKTAQQHLAREHAGVASPDPSNPSGYRQENHYTGILIGEPINRMSPEDAKAMDAEVRKALREKLAPRYRDSRAYAEATRAAKPALPEEEISAAALAAGEVYPNG